MESKQELLAALRDVFDRWDGLLWRLSEEQIVARQLPSDLSIKDVVAHLAAWQQLSIARLAAALHNRELDFHLGPPELNPADENLEAVNGWIHRTYLDWPWSDVYRDWKEGFLRFLEMAEAIPERELLQVGKYAWLGELSLAAVLRGSYEHHQEEHYEPLVAWLKEHGIIS